MVKIETLGMLDVAKVNPILKSDNDVANYSFLTIDGDLYLISNTLTGDDAYKEDTIIPAGEYLNGFMVEAWKGQKLVIDGKHVDGGIDSLDVGATLVAQEDGSLKAGSATEGVYFVVTDTNITLTEAAIKVKVTVA